MDKVNIIQKKQFRFTGLLSVFICFCLISKAQTAIFTESIGTVASTTTLASHESANGFDNDAYTMTSGGATNPVDIRNSSASSGYSGASGNANVWFTNTSGQYGFAIEGIDASAYTSLTIDFAVRKEGASGTAFATFALDYWDGTSYQAVSLSGLPVSTSAAGWYLISGISLPAAAQINGLKLRFTKAGSIACRLDDITLKGIGSAPSVSLSVSSLTGFTYISGNGPSANQTFTCSGSNLSSTISLTAPTDYEISLSSGSGFGSSLSLSPTTGTVAATTIYTRLKSGLAIGTYNNEVITAASTGASNQTVTCNGTVTASAASDIITAGGEATSISSLINNATPLSSTTGIQIWQFKVRDGGATLNDADNLPTILNSFTISQAAGNAVSNWAAAIKTIELFDGASNIAVGTVTTGPNQISFTGLSLSVPDNTEKTYSLRMSLNCGIGSANNDGDDFGFQISQGNVTFSTSGSGKFAFTAASTTNSQNVIDVAATQLVFTQQPTTTGMNTVMSPAVTVAAKDACGNIDINFTSSVSITSTGTLVGTTVSATAVAGIATFSTLTHSVAGTGFTLTAASGIFSITSNSFDIFITTVLGGGDLAIVGICVNIDACNTTSSGTDEISFVTFEDITPGTAIDITDNGFERVGCGSNNWGNTEGVIRITRTTSTIAKGTVITIRVVNNTYFAGVSPDANWTITYPVGNQFNLNNTDEQVYLMQGGTWSAGTSGSHNATYTGGTYMFAINTYTSWTCNDNTTTRGNLPLALKCFSIMPSTGTVNVKYTGPITPANQKDWIDRINSVSNWSSSTNCSGYYSQSPAYETGQVFSIVSGSYNSGYWTGAANTDWFDCNNWQNYKVPDSLANVTIDNVANDPIIGASPVLYPNGAICNDMLITSTSGSGILTLNNSLSYLSIKGNVTNDGIITATNGLVDFRSSNAQAISGNGTTTFYKLRLNNTNTLGVSLSQDVNVANQLTFSNGMLTTGVNKLIITNTTVPTITGYTNVKFINGNLRHYIGNNTSTYVFPIGDGMASANYKRADLVNSGLTGINYIDAFVNTITETAPNDDATFAGAGQTQNGSGLGYIMENAQWDLSPDAIPTAGSYGVRLYVANTGLSVADDDQFFAVKRPSASTTYADWVSLDGSTTIPVSGAAGRIYNSGAGYAERLGYTTFSKHAIATTFTPLPIELLTFTGTALQEKVRLNWTTATETNNDYFTIEKSSDAINFIPVGKVKGAGNSTTINNYSQFDLQPYNGINYYRLKQTDFNGKYSYSNVIAVTMEMEFSEFIYPNPATSKLNIMLTKKLQVPVTIEVINIEGVVLISKSFNDSEDEKLSIDLNGISAGTYILRTKIENKTKQILFIKQ
jgi:hypothetical protein